MKSHEDTMAAHLAAAGLALRSHDAFYVAERPRLLAQAQGIAKRWPSPATRLAVETIQRDIFNDMFPRRPVPCLAQS